MKVPADAFQWIGWSALTAGRLASQGEHWFLLVDIGYADDRSRPAIVLTGAATGELVDLARTGGAFLVVGNGYTCVPLLEQPPAATGTHSAPGALVVGPQGPFLRTWYQEEPRRVFNLRGSEVSDDVPARAPSCAVWSMGLIGPNLSEPVRLFTATAVLDKTDAR